MKPVEKIWAAVDNSTVKRLTEDEYEFERSNMQRRCMKNKRIYKESVRPAEVKNERKAEPKYKSESRSGSGRGNRSKKGRRT